MADLVDVPDSNCISNYSLDGGPASRQTGLVDAPDSKHISNNCPDGGTGRRARLKIWLSKGSAGSIPVLGTKKASQVVGLFHLGHTAALLHSMTTVERSVASGA